MKNKVLVSIICDVYNHEPYLRLCLDGFVFQKTNFPFEVLIHDDASTDNSPSIIIEYTKKYPDIFKPIIQKENQYSKKVGIWKTFQFPRVSGKYVAFCEGDDYWTDPLKLQKQVDYLETHPECVLVHTDMDVEDVQTGKVNNSKWKHQKNFNLIKRDFGKRLLPLLLQGKYSVTTLTACVRFDALRECYEAGLSSLESGLLMGDTTKWMALAAKGTFHLIPESCACYHVLGESATHSRNYSNIINFYASCLKMIDSFSEKFNISDRDKDVAIQKYIFFLLRDVYTNKREYLAELKERILQNRRLDISNSILLKTMQYNCHLKKMLLFFVESCQGIKHMIEFNVAKYFGIV